MENKFNLPESVINFSNYLETIKNKSDKTVKGYQSDLGLFFKHLLIQRKQVSSNADFDKINSCYLHAAILSEPVQRRINERVKGIAQKTLNLSEVKALRIPLPGMEQQKIFEAFSVQVDKSKYYRFKFISLCRKIVNIEEEMLCQTLSF